MPHDPLCRGRYQLITPVERCADCDLIACVRHDERGKTLDAAREAVVAVAVRKDTSHDMRVQAIAAIDTLREDRSQKSDTPPSAGYSDMPITQRNESRNDSHLSECPVPAMEAGHGPLHPDDAEANCICDRLRACEQRVLHEAWVAVAALHFDWLRTEADSDYARDHACAAIDALREKS